MYHVKVFRSDLNRVAHECDVVTREEGMALAREAVHGMGVRNTREFFESIVGYSHDGREAIHVSVRKIED